MESVLALTFERMFYSDSEEVMQILAELLSASEAG